MTKLAIYDKKYGESDRKHNSFFRNEYVYWKNFWARVYAFFGSLILVSLYVLNELTVKKVDVFELDYKQEGINILVFIMVVLAVVTVLSGIKATWEYSKIQERIKRRLSLTKKLDAIAARERLENTSA
jgi:hypothetical protein